MRVAIALEYDGTPFCGWQSQPAQNSVQDAVEAALSRVAGGGIRVHASGRTDAGVHARCQVAHFDTDVGNGKQRAPDDWQHGGNYFLPKAIRILWAQEAAGNFHARHRAGQRHYQYLLCCSPTAPALWRDKVGHCRQPLAVEAMREAAAFLIGRHDFSAFRASSCQAKSPVRTMSTLSIDVADDFFIFSFSADGFLQQMVRNIVGGLIAVGKQQQPPIYLKTVLAGQRRQHTIAPAKAAGLYLTGADYPASFALPSCRCRLRLVI